MKPEKSGKDDPILDETLGRLLDRGLAVRPSPAAVDRVVARALAAVDRDRQAQRFRVGPRRAVAAAAVLLIVCGAAWRVSSGWATTSPGAGGAGGDRDIARVAPPRQPGVDNSSNVPEPTAVAALDATLADIERIDALYLGTG